MGVCSSKTKQGTSSSDSVQEEQQLEQKQARSNEAAVAAAGTAAAVAAASSGAAPAAVAAATPPMGEPVVVTQEPVQVKDQPVKVADAAAAELPLADVTSSEPATPQPVAAAADADGTETPAHTYNSAEKPFRSALRTSFDTNKLDYSRRSSSGMSNVGFSVGTSAPESGLEGPKHSFAGADSISLKKILDMFYDKVVAHEEIGHFFRGIDLVKLKRHQLSFMGLAFGGKELVKEQDPNLNLRKIHYHLIRDRGLSLAHWEEFVALFAETLNQLEKEIPQDARESAMRSILATKHYFVPIGEEDEYTNTNIAAMPVPEKGGELRCPFAGAAAADEVQQQQ